MITSGMLTKTIVHSRERKEEETRNALLKRENEWLANDLVKLMVRWLSICVFALI